jgi:elongator complex protein 3
MNKLAKNIVIKLAKRVPKNENELGAISRRATKGLSESMPVKSELIKAYHELVASGKLKRSTALERILRKRSVRTLSGVTIITVLTKPHPCPGKCIYCPDEPGMPKSYISDEPAAARALTLRFDPYDQVVERIKVLEKNGHPTDKIELIVKGGSWSAYPLAYQYWFILRCFEAANSVRSSQFAVHKQLLEKTKNKLFKEQKRNESAKHRVIGLTLETRPDLMTNTTAETMRELGCTRVELGVQTTDDKILKLVRRGHDSAETIRATKLLKNFGFKVDYHLMPMLPGATPAKDLKMMKEIFDNPDYRPDMIKIYPCTAVKNSPLYRWVKSGKYKPYSDKKLIELLINYKTTIPRYARLSRLIRDIPGHHIVAGNRVTNLRQVIQAEMARRGLRCNCLRCREIGHQNTPTLQHLNTATLKPKMFIDKYEASGGVEYFLSFEDAKRNVIFAFCRLRLPSLAKRGTEGESPDSPPTPLLSKGGRIALLRELHTYGQSLTLQHKNTETRKHAQHRGLGKKLIAEVEKICKKNKIPKLAVISGVGVRDYYRKLGYKLENGYMIKKF